MSFVVTITNVPDKDLGPLIARLRLPRGAKVEQKYVPDHVGLLEGPQNGKRRRMPADTKLTMTGKRPQKGSALEKALEGFEKLEAKHGIGSVSMAMLQEDCGRRKLQEKTAGRLLKAGFVQYLE